MQPASLRRPLGYSEISALVKLLLPDGQVTPSLEGKLSGAVYARPAKCRLGQGGLGFALLGLLSEPLHLHAKRCEQLVPAVPRDRL